MGVPDDGLLGRASRGDEQSFVKLYEQHRDPVFRFIRRLCGSREMAEDVTQECFISLIRNPPRFDPRRASLRTYLCATARNLAFTRLRREGREEPIEEGEDGEEPDAAAPGPLDRILDSELHAAVARAVAGLPPLQREAVILFEYEDLTLAEIAEVASADVGTIKSRLHRGRERLRRSLAGYLNGGRGVEAAGRR